MDRNYIIKITAAAPRVALRKESVDRNKTLVILTKQLDGSLSARRAWIEIRVLSSTVIVILRSLSARRAWIEIKVLSQPNKPRRRSPQGERG